MSKVPGSKPKVLPLSQRWTGDLGPWTVFVVCFLIRSLAWAGYAKGGIYEMTKDLTNTPGSSLMAQGIYSLAISVGEVTAGGATGDFNRTVFPGYFGGGFGSGLTFKILRSTIGTKLLLQDGFQVGVPLDASAQIDFSDSLQPSSMASGLAVVITANHLGQRRDDTAKFQTSLDTVNKRLTITPDVQWDANTLYDIVMTPQLLSVDGFSLERIAHVPFVTVLDPHQDNVVLHPSLDDRGAPADSGAEPTAGSLNIHVPPESLAAFSAVLFTKDPVHTPLRVNPQIILDANEKARLSGSGYQIPLIIHEINAYDANGVALGPLAKSADLTFTLDRTSGLLAGASSLVRTNTLSWWVLDETHHLWAKMPASQHSAKGQITASASRFAVFALMGQASNSTIDSFVFPVPWRPHGPNAGTGPGQSGTVGDGLTFNNLPSECSIKIYAIGGELVRELRHSDTSGSIAQEKWDATTRGGAPVASGVYLWRVESPTDSKNGKLMIIR